MSTKTVSTATQSQQERFNQQQQYQFDPQSMARYQQMQGQAAGVLGDYMQNPLLATFFRTQQQMANRQLGQASQSGITQLMQNLGPQMQGSPLMQALLAQHQRSFTGQRAGAFQNLLMGAQQARQWATGQAMGMGPLQTGQTAGGTSSMTGTSTQTTKKSGLGTWLPQLVGAGIGAVTGGLGGGGGAAGGGAGGAASGAGGMAPWPGAQYQSPFYSNPYLQPSRI